MPLSKDPEKGGTNVDGSKTTEYCSYGYKKGAFCAEDVKNAKEMQELMKGKLSEKGYGRFMQCLFTLEIPRLKRWQKKG